jgi:hypothetical protein
MSAHMEKIYDPKLLPGIRLIRETWTGPNIEATGLWDYNNFMGSVQLAYSYASLFWPDFVEVNGALILAEHYTPENFQHWLEYWEGDLTGVEKMINNVHIESLFMNNKVDNELDDQVWNTVMAVLEEMWRACVKARFPGESIIVAPFDPHDGSTPQLTIYRER